MRAAVGYRQGISRRKQNRVISLVSGEIDCSQNVLAFERRVVFEDLIEIRAGAEKLQNVAHPDSHAANTGSPTTLGIIECNAAEVTRGHDVVLLFQFTPKVNCGHGPNRSPAPDWQMATAAQVTVVTHMATIKVIGILRGVNALASQIRFSLMVQDTAVLSVRSSL
jgi:hypothetical protein